MPKESTILQSLKNLRRNIRAGEVPSYDELIDLAADWASILSDVTDDDLTAAVTTWLRGDCPFWPTPGQLLALTPKRRIAAIDDSPTAWSAVLRYFRRGSFRSPNPGELDPSDPERDAAMRAALNEIGGARAFGQSQESEEQWWGKRFGEAYKAHRKRGHVVAEVLQIGGPQAAARLTGSGFRRITGES